MLQPVGDADGVDRCYNVQLSSREVAFTFMIHVECFILIRAAKLLIFLIVLFV